MYRFHTDLSLRREALDRNNKTLLQLDNSQPDAMALWFTLAGARSIVVTRWDQSASTVRRIVQSVWQGLAEHRAIASAIKTSAQGNESLKARARAAHVVYGLPHVTYTSTK